MYQFIKNLPLVRGYVHDTVAYHVGTAWENRLGLQIFRTLSQYLQFKIRRRRLDGEIRDFVASLDRDGIVVIENFLERSQFEAVRKEFDQAFEEIDLKPYKNVQDAKLSRAQISVSESRAKFINISALFEQNDRLNRIASAAVRRKFKGIPKVHLDLYQSADRDGVDNDVENILHADLHTATVKMFFYVNEVDESNGAFVYAKTSHRCTAARLLHEYELGVRQARLKKNLPIESSLVCLRGKEIRNIIHPKHREKMRITETQISVKPNTLVIANNMGFHRRGEFTSDKPRKSVQVNFRYLERPFGKDLFSRQSI